MAESADPTANGSVPVDTPEDPKAGHRPGEDAARDAAARREVETRAENSPLRHSRRAREPRGNPAARYLGVIIGLLLLALGLVAGRELWLRNSDVGWRSWLDPVFGFFRGLEFQPWMGWVGIGLVVLGLLLLIIALKPRPRTHRALKSPVSIWARPVDIARYATANARRTPGVRSASTSVKRRTATLEVTAVAPDSEVRPALEETVGTRLKEAFGDGVGLRTRIRRADENDREEDR